MKAKLPYTSPLWFPFNGREREREREANGAAKWRKLRQTLIVTIAARNVLVMLSDV